MRVVFSSGGAAYAGTGAGLYRSVGGGAWTPVAQGAEDDPRNPKKLNASVQAVLDTTGGPLLAGTAFRGVFRSTDGGATWAPPAPGNGMPAGETVWSLDGIGPLVFAATSSGVYRSFDYGGSWSLASDGIPGAALRVIGDGTNPNITYAATAGDGIFRSLDLGLTWAPINAGLGNLTVRGIQQFSVGETTRLYAATGDGLWTGTTGNRPLLPGAVRWRRVTQRGLGGATIMWAVSSFLTTPGTLLVGTQSNGGFWLTFEPPSNSGRPTATALLGAEVGKTLLGSPGTWEGTPTITLTRQWQRCTARSDNTCRDIPGEDGAAYTMRSDSDAARSDQGKYLRLKVTAENDFPAPGPLTPTAYSDWVGPVAAGSNSLPAGLNGRAASIRVVRPGDPSLPRVGDTLEAYDWLFNPRADTTYFKWLRCDADGNACMPIAGADEQTYELTTADAEVRLRVQVSGLNGAGAGFVPVSGYTNTIIPDPATAVAPPTLAGAAVVGSTLVGGVGAWKSEKTRWERRWELCEADGNGCNPVSNETAPGYVVRPGDLGKRLRMRVLADVNESYKLPAATELYTPLSGVVTPAPVIGGGGQPPGPAPAPAPAPVPPARDVTRPRLGRAGSRVMRAGIVLSTTTSEAGTLTIAVQRGSVGHRARGRCRAGRRRSAKACTVWKTVRTVRRAVRAGAAKVTVPRRAGKSRLAAGSYRAQLVVRDAAGNASATKTVTFRLR
ncbi:MAG TPA: hypothetical protein VLK58_07925 [Conexibacter sp.]|nr:hypothetical protein [Conexibacter sp.]